MKLRYVILMLLLMAQTAIAAEGRLARALQLRHDRAAAAHAPAVERMRDAPPARVQRREREEVDNVRSYRREDDDHRGRHFSPEERRQLRRDINEAGRHLYRRFRRR